ncbi:hypothetical protein [Neorhodopirellula lusitana]|uniref:hypothetical protein n=1 Tax=Neorhodopirellula lusitana TaxID=445327 RepID=UPI0024B67D8F|nr:hypothetical protein [Neorhodopirellula lusitana]
MTTQDGNGLKDHDGGETDRGKQAAVDWDAINASIRVKAWRGYKAGLYPQQRASIRCHAPSETQSHVLWRAFAKEATIILNQRSGDDID